MGDIEYAAGISLILQPLVLLTWGWLATGSGSNREKYSTFAQGIPEIYLHSFILDLTVGSVFLLLVVLQRLLRLQ